MASSGDEDEEPTKVIVSPQETSRCRCEYLKNSCVASLTPAARDSTAGHGWNPQLPDSASSDDVVNDKPVCEALEKSKVILKTIGNNRPSHEAVVKAEASSESIRINKPICKVLEKSKSILEALEQEEESKVQVPLPTVSCGRPGGRAALPTHFRRPVCQYLLQAMENFPLFTSASFNRTEKEGRDAMSSGRPPWEHARPADEALRKATASVSTDEALARATASVLQLGERKYRTSGTPTKNSKEWRQESQVHSVPQTAGAFSAKQIPEKLDLKQPEFSTASETQGRHTNFRNQAEGNIREGHQRDGDRSSSPWTEQVCQYLGQTRVSGSYTEPSGAPGWEHGGAFTPSRNTIPGDHEGEWKTPPPLDPLFSTSFLKENRNMNLSNEFACDSFTKATTSTGTQTDTVDYSLNIFPVDERTRPLRHRTCGYLHNKTGNSAPLTSIKCEYLNIKDGNSVPLTGITCEYLNSKTESSVPSTGTTCDYLDRETGNSVSSAGITCEYLKSKTRNSTSHASLTCDYLHKNRNSSGLTNTSCGQGVGLGSGWKCDTRPPQQPDPTGEDSPATNTAQPNRLENIYRVNIDANSCSCVSSGNQEAVASNGDGLGCTEERRPTFGDTKPFAVKTSISQNLTNWTNNGEQDNNWETNTLEKNAKQSQALYDTNKLSQPLYGTEKLSQPLYGTNKPSQPLYGTNKPSQPLYGTNKLSQPLYGKNNDKINPAITDRFSGHFSVRKNSLAAHSSGSEAQVESRKVPGRPSDMEGNETHSLHATLNCQQFINTKNKNKNTSRDVSCSENDSSGKEEIVLQSRVPKDRVLPSNTGRSSLSRRPLSDHLKPEGQKYSPVDIQDNKLVTEKRSNSSRSRTIRQDSSEVQNAEVLPGRPQHRQYLTKGYSGSESSVRSGCKVLREGVRSAKCGINSQWLESDQRPHHTFPAPAAVQLAPVPSTAVLPASVPSTTVLAATVLPTSARVGKASSYQRCDYISKIAIKNVQSQYSDIKKGKPYVRTNPDTVRTRVDTVRTGADTTRPRCGYLENFREDHLSFDHNDGPTTYNIRRNNFHNISKESDEQGTEIPESVIEKTEIDCMSTSGGSASQESASHGNASPRDASHVPNASSKSPSTEDRDIKPIVYIGQSYFNQTKVKGHHELNTSDHISKLLTEREAENPVSVAQTSSDSSQCVSSNETPRGKTSASLRRRRVRTGDSTPTHLVIKDKGDDGRRCRRPTHVSINRLYPSTPSSTLCCDDSGQSTDDEPSSSSHTQGDTSAYCTMEHHNKEDTSNLQLSRDNRTTTGQLDDQESALLRTSLSNTSDLSYSSDLSNASSVSYTSGLSHTSGLSKVSTLPLTSSLSVIRSLSRTSTLSKTSSLSNTSGVSKAGSLSRFSTLTMSNSLSTPLSLSRASTIPALLSLSRNSSINGVASHDLSEDRYEEFSGSLGSERSDGTLQKYDHNLVVSLTSDSDSPRENDLGLVTLTLTPRQLRHDPGHTT